MRIPPLVIETNADLVAQESSALGHRVCDQRFGFGELQAQGLPQELSELPLNRLSLGACAAQSEQEVVRVTHVMQAAIRGIIGDRSWHGTRLFRQSACQVAILPDPSSPPYGCGEPMVG